METTKSSWSWGFLFLITLAACFLFIFNEWLFLVTKPSFLNSLGLAQQLNILLATVVILAGLCFLCLLPLVLLSLLTPLRRYKKPIMLAGIWLPAVIAAVLALMMLDNFTYTIFRFGIVSTVGWSRALYCLGFIFVVVLCFRRMRRSLDAQSQRIGNTVIKPLTLFSLVMPVFLFSFFSMVNLNKTSGLAISAAGGSGPETQSAQPRVAQAAVAQAAVAGSRPHIFLITSDGVDASHMSVYGYGRETTPRIAEIANEALIAEYAFPNAATSTGSIISIYTGKYPSETRVLYPPDILKGENSYEHLLGILRSLGYRTVQITMPHYLDVSELNLLDGFDEVRTSSLLRRADHSKYLFAMLNYMPTENALFVDEIFKRVADRMRHIFFLKKMVNPYDIVTDMADPLQDDERFHALRQEIQKLQQPLFVHVHLVCTHGEKFNIKRQVFSAGQAVASQEPWDDDFYDDSIREADHYVGEFADALKNLGLLEQSILIIGSDHGQQWNPLHRIPLIIRFPGGQYAGRILANVQNLDIAPTVLDYMDIEQPDWMRGESLITGALANRPIFSFYPVAHDQMTEDGLIISKENMQPPFYQFGGMTMIYCQRFYRLHLSSLRWEAGNVEGGLGNCLTGSEITDAEAFQLMVAHLQEYGFDIADLDQIP
jgi:glucan phosphoethanolaminetransferase (alkaline phosphatase superfamily)